MLLQRGQGLIPRPMGGAAAKAFLRTCLGDDTDKGVCLGWSTPVAVELVAAAALGLTPDGGTKNAAATSPGSRQLLRQQVDSPGTKRPTAAAAAFAVACNKT